MWLHLPLYTAAVKHADRDIVGKKAAGTKSSTLGEKAALSESSTYTILFNPNV